MSRKHNLSENLKDRSEKKKAIIIGCGIGGPSLAIALNRAGIDSTIYESHESIPKFGWLTITANGTTIWKSFGIFDEIMSASTKIEEMIACDSHGKHLGKIDTSKELEKKYDAGTILIRREIFNKILCDKARSNGVKIEFGKKLTNIETKTSGNHDEGKVTASFEDGTKTEGDFLVGCDGIHSRTRSVIMPDSPKPTYTGVVLVGGTVKKNNLDVNTNENTMYLTYGKNAFFGNLLPESGDHMWWSYAHNPESIDEENNQNTLSWEDWKKKLLQTHKDDSDLVKKSINAPEEMNFQFPIYDISHIPIWHKGLVCLMGDAAHATSPHVGQGAVMAIEDGIVLAKCLRDIQDIQKAFETFEKLRKSRTEKVVKMAQKYGDAFTTTNPIKKWFRNRMVPIMIKRGNEPFDWIYSYKIDWDEKIK